MEKTITIQDDMEGQAGDIMDIQYAAQNRDDHIVNDGIDDGLLYWGFVVTKSSATTIDIATKLFQRTCLVYCRSPRR